MDGYVFTIVMVAVIGGFLFLLTIAAGLFQLIGGRRRSRSLSEEENKMLQDLWLGLQKMEERIENLETILLHRERKQ